MFFYRFSGLGELCIASGRFVWLRDVAVIIPGPAGLPAYRQPGCATVFHDLRCDFHDIRGRARYAEGSYG